MRKIALRLSITSCAIGLLIGCGAAAPAPAPASPTQGEAKSSAAPQAAAATTPSASPDAAKESTATAEPAKEESPKPADEPRDGLRKASRPPLDLLTGNNVVYVFNFTGSAKGDEAKAQCESAGDPPAVRECLAAERAKIAVESARFVKDQHGQYWWVTYNRYKGNLLKWHKVQFLPGKEDADTISLTLVGKDKGIAPMAHVPASLKIELPNDYSIVVSDPEYGNMVFDAKIGLMDKDSD
jgi:hypothetical protein